MHKKKLARGLAASFSIIACVIATLFCDIVAFAYVVFPPSHRLVYDQGNYALEVLLGVGGNFLIASALSAMLFFFVHKKLLTIRFHKAVFVVIAALSAAPQVLLLISTMLGAHNPSKYELSFRSALLAYMLPVICEYSLVRKKYLQAIGILETA